MTIIDRFRLTGRSRRWRRPRHRAGDLASVRRSRRPCGQDLIEAGCADCDALVEQTLETFGRFDVLVNIAAPHGQFCRGLSHDVRSQLTGTQNRPDVRYRQGTGSRVTYKNLGPRGMRIESADRGSVRPASDPDPDCEPDFGRWSSTVKAALLTRMSGGPNESCVVATNRKSASSSATSQITATACPPSRRIPSATSWIVPGRRSSLACSVRAATATATPSAASRCTARSIPRLAPVTMATRPDSHAVLIRADLPSGCAPTPVFTWFDLRRRSRVDPCESRSNEPGRLTPRSVVRLPSCTRHGSSCSAQ
jgi:hypothetical protein